MEAAGLGGLRYLAIDFALRAVSRSLFLLAERPHKNVHGVVCVLSNQRNMVAVL